jgi:Protein of unknown function (DUF3500)
MNTTLKNSRPLAALSVSLLLFAACGASSDSASPDSASAGSNATPVVSQPSATATSAEESTTNDAPDTTVAVVDTTADDGPDDSDGGGSPGGRGGPGGGFGNQCEASGVAPVAAPQGAVPSAPDAATVASGVSAALGFLGTLSADQKTAAVFDYADLDAKRCSWSNFPSGIFDGRVGIRMGDLDDTQRAAALAVVESLMSAGGYTYATNAVAGDQNLAEGGESNMGEDNYFLAFYGDPSPDAPWTMQFGGHHLAIHISVGGEALSITPYFAGIQPLSFELEGTTIEAMKVDADHMFGIFESMDEAQLAKAEIAGGYDDLVMGPGTDIGYPTAEGTPYAELTVEQQALVKSAISDWVGDMAPGLSGPLVALYESQLDQTTVGWSSSIDRRSGAYMRIDGPRVWIEWVNTTAGGGLHYHTIYRDKLLDYGTGTGADQ